MTTWASVEPDEARQVADWLEAEFSGCPASSATLVQMGALARAHGYRINGTWVDGVSEAIVIDSVERAVDTTKMSQT